MSALFTGAAEQPSEQSMLSAGLISPATVLKVGHHGSSTSSSLAFLQTLRPQFAVISAGRDNQYGHPTQQTLTDLAAAVGARFEYTDTTTGDDSVTFTTNCSTYTWSTPPTSAQYPGMALGGTDQTPTTNHTPTVTRTIAATPPAPPGNNPLPACYHAGQNTCNCSDFTSHS